MLNPTFYTAGLDKVNLTHPIFLAHSFTCTPDRARKIKTAAQSQSTPPMEKQLKAWLFVFLPKYGWRLSFSNIFISKVFAMKLQYIQAAA